MISLKTYFIPENENQVRCKVKTILKTIVPF
jgi:hypothetical protein